MFVKISEFLFFKDFCVVFEEFIEVFVENLVVLLKWMFFDGVWLIWVWFGDVLVVVIWYDFWVNVGSYGKSLFCCMKVFLEICDSSWMLLVVKIMLVGVWFMEGWMVFDFVFELVLILVGYRERNFVFMIVYG